MSRFLDQTICNEDSVPFSVHQQYNSRRRSAMTSMHAFYI
jgi:hypothetical protein